MFGCKVGKALHDLLRFGCCNILFKLITIISPAKLVYCVIERSRLHRICTTNIQYDAMIKSLVEIVLDNSFLF